MLHYGRVRGSPPQDEWKGFRLVFLSLQRLNPPRLKAGKTFCYLQRLIKSDGGNFGEVDGACGAGRKNFKEARRDEESVDVVGVVAHPLSGR